MTGFGNGERDNALQSFRPFLEAFKPSFVSEGEANELWLSGRDLPPGAVVGEEQTESVTAEAERLVSGRRGPDYGHPLDNHTATAEMWSAYLRRKHGVKIEIDADDVCWMNIFQKASRDANAPKRDNLTDTAGYALNIDMIRRERDERHR